MELHGRKKALRAISEVFPGCSEVPFSLSFSVDRSLRRGFKQEGGEAHYIGQPSYLCAPR